MVGRKAEKSQTVGERGLQGGGELSALTLLRNRMRTKQVALDLAKIGLLVSLGGTFSVLFLAGPL